MHFDGWDSKEDAVNYGEVAAEQGAHSPQMFAAGIGFILDSGEVEPTSEDGIILRKAQAILDKLIGSAIEQE